MQCQTPTNKGQKAGVNCSELQKSGAKLQKSGANVVQNLVISKLFRNFAAQKKFYVMEQQEMLERLLILAEKQQGNIDALNDHICELENIVKAQQRTIDTLTEMSRNVYITNINGNNNCNNCGAGTQILETK